MTTISRRLISLALVFIMMISAVPFAVSAAVADVAEEALQVDLAETGTTDYAAISEEDFFVSGLSFTTAGYAYSNNDDDYTDDAHEEMCKWSSEEEGVLHANIASNGTHEYTSCNETKTSNDIYTCKSYLRITALQDGILSFKYAAACNTDIDYLVYRKNGEPSDSTYDGVKATGNLNVGYSDVPAWESAVDIPLFKDDYVCVIFYKDGSYSSGSQTGWIKEVNFNTDVTRCNVNISKTGEGTVSKTDSKTGTDQSKTYTVLNGMSAGKFYCVPNVDAGYELDGVYTSDSYSPESRVEPENGRLYNFIAGATDTNYYVRFVQRTPVTFTLNYDTNFITGVKYSKVSAFNDTDIPINYNSKSTDVADGGTVTFYPYDILSFSYSNASGKTNLDYVFNGFYSGDTLLNSSTKFIVDSTLDGQNIRISTSDNTYEDITGYTPYENSSDDVSFSTRKLNKWTVDTTTDPDKPMLVSGNSGVADSGSYICFTAKKAGYLLYDYKVSSQANSDYLYIKKGGDPSASSKEKSYTGEVDWTSGSYQVAAGDKIYFAYIKSNDGNGGDDHAYLRFRGIDDEAVFRVKLSSSDYSYGTVTYQYNYDEIATPDEASTDNEAPTVIEKTKKVTYTSDSTENYFDANIATQVTVTANLLDGAGGQFIRWVRVDGAAETTLSFEKEYTFSLDSDITLKAIFVKNPTAEETVAIIRNSSNTTKFSFSDVADAIDTAVFGDKVIITNNCNLTRDAIIPSGVTLLVPFDSGYTTYTTKPACEHSNKAIGTAYKKLIINDNCTLTVNGSISVSAKCHCNDTSVLGSVWGNYGELKLNGANAKIVLNSGANLYAWGFVTGNGLITAKSGANVYEYFEIQDFRGGTQTSSMAGETNQFPFSQYYIQNIQCDLRIDYGATENVYAQLYVRGARESSVKFIDSNNGLFRLAEGSYLIRHFDVANDKMYYNIYGDTVLGALSLSVGGYGFNSSGYYLPINNLVVELTEGSTLSTEENVLLMPGSGVKIDEGATLLLESGSNVMVADKDISPYCKANSKTAPCIVSKGFPSDATHTTRTWAKTETAYLDNNGDVVVEKGAALGSTPNGAKIYSSENKGTFAIYGSTNPEAIEKVLDDSNGSGFKSGTYEVEQAELQNGTGAAMPTTDTGDRWSSKIDAVYTYDESTNTWEDIRTVHYYAYSPAAAAANATNCYAFVNTASGVKVTTRVAQGESFVDDNSDDGQNFKWEFNTTDSNGIENYHYTFAYWDYDVYSNDSTSSRSSLKFVAATGASVDLTETGAAPAITARAVYSKSPVEYTYTFRGFGPDGVTPVVREKTVSYGDFPIVSTTDNWPDDIAQSYTVGSKKYNFSGWEASDGTVYANGNALPAVVSGNLSFTAVYRASFENVYLAIDEGIVVKYIVNLPDGYDSSNVGNLRVNFSWGYAFDDNAYTEDYDEDGVLRSGYYHYHDGSHGLVKANTASSSLVPTTGGRYIAELRIAAKEINDVITAKLVDVRYPSAEALDTEGTFSAAYYLTNAYNYDLDALAKNTFGGRVTDAKLRGAQALKDLCWSTLCYGASAQVSLMYRTDNLFDSSLADKHDDSTRIDSVKREVIANYYDTYCDPENPDSLESIIWETNFRPFGFRGIGAGTNGYYGSALTLDYKTSYDLYFLHDSYRDYTVTARSTYNPISGENYNGNQYTYVVDRDNVVMTVDDATGDYVRLDILDIPADHLLDTIEVTMTLADNSESVTFDVSPLVYICNVFMLGEDQSYAEGQAAAEALKVLAANAYLYSDNAWTFFDYKATLSQT